MDKQRMTFDIDRRKVTEGDVVEITWQCEGAEQVALTIDNGYKASSMALDIAGNKRFRLNRSKGRTRLTVTASVAGKDYSKTIKVKVSSMPVTHAETVDRNGRPVGPLRQWLDRLGPRWQSARSRLRLSWQAMSPAKQLATRILLIIAAIMLLSALWPAFLFIGMTGLAIYLFWVVWKR